MDFEKMTIQEQKENSLKVIHMGFPMYFYEPENILWGFWSFIANWFPSVAPDYKGYPNFVFITYKGSYWKALKDFIIGDLK
jgi:hypothetical protein